MGYFLNYSGTKFAINEEEIVRLIFYSKDQSRRIILYYMASTQICQNETSSIPSRRDDAFSGVGMFNRVNGEEISKI